MNFETISARKIDDYLEDDHYFIIDLRTRNEYKRAHIRGAYNIPYENLQLFADYPKEKEYILYCSRGSISLMAARQLSEVGYRVKSVIGGIHVYNGRNLVKG